MNVDFQKEFEEVCSNPNNVMTVIDKIMRERPSEFLYVISGFGFDDDAKKWSFALNDYKEFSPFKRTDSYPLLETEYVALAKRHPDIKKAFHVVNRGDNKYYICKMSKLIGALRETVLTPTHLIAVYSQDIRGGFSNCVIQEKLTFVGTYLKPFWTRTSEKYINKLGLPQEFHMCWTGSEILISVGNVLYIMNPVDLLVRCNDHGNNLDAPVLELREDDDENNDSSNRRITIITQTGHFEYANGQVKKKD